MPPRRTRNRKNRDRYEKRGSWFRRKIVAAWRGVPVERSFPPPKSAGDLAGQVLADLNLADRIAMEDLTARWSEAVGEPFSSGTRPVAIRHGMLQVAVTHPTLHYSIRGMESAVLKKLQKEFGADKIKGIKFSHG